MNNIIMMPVGDVKPYPNNPRENKDAVEKVAESIREFGFQQPIVVDKDNVVIVGHTRLKAAKKLKMKEVPVVVADQLSEEQVKAYRLADNKTGEFATWELDQLLEELQAITEINMEDFGFDLSMLDEVDTEVIEDEAPEAPQEPITEPGQIYRLGRHRLICGDATKVEDMQKLLNGNKADLYLTDPPYNVAYEGATKDKLTIMNDNMSDEKFRTFLRDSFEAARANMKAGASFYIWHADSEGFNFRGACRDVGWTVRETLIWKKNAMVLGRQDYQWKHEPCLYGWNDGSHTWYGDRKQTTILEFDRPTVNKEHPTMKPVALFDYLIKNSSKKEDIVLDNFGGSGTTIIACEQNGRCGYSSELDPKYCDVIIQRYINLVGSDKDVFLVKDDGSEIPYSEVKAEKETQKQE